MRSPSAWKSTTAAQRPADQPLDLDRPPALLAARRLAIGALAGRRRQQRVLGRHPAAAGPVEPARHAVLRPTRCRGHASCPATRARRRAAARGRPGRPRSGEARRAGARRCAHAATSSSATSTCSTSPSGNCKNRSPSARKSAGSPVVRNRYAPSRPRVVLEALACERLGDLACGLVGGEDERHVAAERPLEDGSQQRVVRAAEDDRVAARRLERRGVFAHGRDDLVAVGSPASISGTSFGHATA